MPSDNRFVYIHGEIVPAENAFLHINDLAIQRGYGIFDFFKISHGHAFFLNEYLHRFYHSAEAMRLPVPLHRDALTAVIRELVSKNDLPESGIKMILTGGYSIDGYQPGKPNLIITQSPLVLPDERVLEQGISIITHEYVRDLPGVKTINYSIGIWLLEKMRQHNAQDVLYHRSGIVSEFPRCNFFIVKQDGTVITPANFVLSGITRKNILALSSNRYKTEEGVVTLQDIEEAKEAFLTSTTKRIVPITNVNDRVVGTGKPGEVALTLLNDLITLEEEDRKRGV
jgi:branched-chain amino acid aminotransferase